MRYLKTILLALTLVIFPHLVHAFEDQEQSDTGEKYHADLRQEHNPKASQSRLTQTLSKASGDIFMARDSWARAVAGYEKSIAYGANVSSLWLSLSEALSKQEDVKRALAAAYMAYKAAKNPTEEAESLFRLGSLYENQSKPKLAMKAYEEGLSLDHDPNVALRYEDLIRGLPLQPEEVRAQPKEFELKNIGVRSEAEPPSICLTFSDELGKGRKTHYGDYIRLQPQTPVVFNVYGHELCVEGLDYGTSYELIALKGLPSASGEKTIRAYRSHFETDDRRESIGFRGSSYILPRVEGQGIPLITVNVDKVVINLLRISDRNLVDEVNSRRIASNLDGYDIDAIKERSGQLLWEGEMEIASIRNQQTTTSFPLSEVLKNPKSGIYIVTAQPAGKRMRR